MPRFSGVSSTTTECLILRKPRPRMHALCEANLPIVLRINVTFILSEAIFYPEISSTDFPRFAANCSGELISFSPFIVAITTFTGFVEPLDFDNTL
jgi:hypothetical protein